MPDRACMPFYDCKRLLSVYFLDILSLDHNFSHTFDPKMHHPAMDS